MAKIFSNILYWSLFLFFALFFLKKYFNFYNEFKFTTQLPKHRLEYFLDFFSFVSNFFISYGIFGTFLGITSGLSTLKFDSLDHLKNNISSLLASMKLAFYSSLAGIIISLLSKWVFDKFSKQIEKRLEELEKSEHEEIIFALSNVQNEIAGLGQSSFSQIAKTLNNEVGNYVDKLQNSTTPIIDNFASKFEKVNSILEISIKAIEDSLSFIRQYNSSVEQSQTKLKTQFEEINKASENIKEISDKLDSTIMHIFEIFKSQDENFQNFYSKIESTKNLIDKFVNISERTTILLSESSKNINGIPEKINEFFNKSKEVIDQYPLTLKRSLSNSFTELDEHIASIVTNFRNITDLINTSVSNFQISVESLNNFQNKLIELKNDLDQSKEMEKDNF